MGENIYNSRHRIIFSILEIVIFLIIFSLMINERTNSINYDIASRLSSVNCGIFLCNGDSTILFHPVANISIYVYLLIFAVGTILSLINYFGLKSIGKLYSVFIWSSLFFLCTISTIMLEMQIGYTLSWSIYFDAFITLNFNTTFIYIIFLLFLVSFFICAYTTIFVVKHGCKTKK